MLFLFASCGGKNTLQTGTLSSESFSSDVVLQSTSSASQRTTEKTTAEITEISTTSESTTAANTSASATAESSTTKTAPKTTEAETQKTQPETDGKGSPTCFVTIDCRNIKDHLSSIKEGKKAFVPKSGYILNETAVIFEPGESAFDALKRACKENVCTDNCEYCKKGGIQLEFSFTPAYKSYYIEGIHQLYEKDCGSFSGWMFSVNGKYGDVSSSEYLLKDGDKIMFSYTVSIGEDLTGAF